MKPSKRIIYFQFLNYLMLRIFHLIKVLLFQSGSPILFILIVNYSWSWRSWWLYLPKFPSNKYWWDLESNVIPIWSIWKPLMRFSVIIKKTQFSFQRQLQPVILITCNHTPGQHLKVETAYGRGKTVSSYVIGAVNLYRKTNVRDNLWHAWYEDWIKKYTSSNNSAWL